MFAVRIYLVGRGTDIWRWLCKRCLRSLQSEGWDVRKQSDPPHVVPCDGEACRETRARMAA